MSKRFTDSTLWDKEWFMELEPTEKLAFLYILSKCDCVGVWSINRMMLKFQTGYTSNITEIIGKTRGNLELMNDKVFVVDFCDYQYGTLTETCKPHKKYIKVLKQHGLFERVCKGYAKGMNTLQEKEKEKEKEEEQEENKEKDQRYSKEFDEAWAIYERRGVKKPAYAAWKSLSKEDRQKAAASIPDYFEEEADPQFRKHFERYLRERVFEGVLERVKNKPKESSGWHQDSSTPMPQQPTQVAMTDGEVLFDNIDEIPF